MSKKTKRRLRSAFIRLTALVLTLLSVFSYATLVLANEIYPEASGIKSGGVYMLRNYDTRRYLTVPGYFEYTQSNGASDNVYQSTKFSNDEYSYAVRITRVENGKYILEPLVFEHFGGGRVRYSSTTGDVCFSQSTSNDTEWIISYNASYAAYELRTSDGRLLAAVGDANGGVGVMSNSQDGNISALFNPEATKRLWYIDSVNVNPHIFKADGSVTKKNLSSGSEWIFELSKNEICEDTQIHSSNSTSNEGDNLQVTIGMDEIAILNSDFIDIAKSECSNRLIIRMRGCFTTPNRAADDYSVVQIPVTRSNGTKSIRTVVIQDIGTGYNDGCQTLPIMSYDYMNTVTVDPAASDFERSYIITFASDVRNSLDENVVVTNWSVENESVAEIFKFNNTDLKGSNFAIIKAKSLGYTFINGLDTEGDTYRKMIEVTHQTSDGVQSIDNVIDFLSIAESNEVLYLSDNTDYLFKTGSELVVYGNWHTTIRSNSYFLHEGENYGIYRARIANNESIGDNNENIVTGDTYCYDDISVNILGVDIVSYSIQVGVNNNTNLYLSNGKYAIRNVEQKLYVQLNDSENASINHIELHSSNGEDNQQWSFEYYAEKKSFLIKPAGNSSLALTLTEATDGAEVTPENFNASDPADNQLWRIYYDYTLNGRTYYIKNYSIVNSELYLGANGGISGQNVIMTDSFGDNTEWKIHIAEFYNWYYQCKYCRKDSERCTCYRIGFWDHSPTVSLTGNIPSGSALVREQYVAAIIDSIAEWNEALGINISYVEGTADIQIEITTQNIIEELFSSNDECVLGVTNRSPELLGKYCEFSFDEHKVDVYLITWARIKIYTHDNNNQMREVMMHEIGHALGAYGHTTTATEIMYYANGAQDGLEVSENETSNLRLLYDYLCS